MSTVTFGLNLYYCLIIAAERGIIHVAKLTLVLPPTHPSMKEQALYPKLPKDINHPKYLTMAWSMNGVRVYEAKEGDVTRVNNIFK